MAPSGARGLASDGDGSGRWVGVCHGAIVADGSPNLALMTLVDLQLQELFDAAKTVQANAYAPYSHFHVGAAIRTTSGTVFSSANMENAAYPEGICAEGGALSAMISAGEREIAAVLVIGPDDRLTTPCGGCRQKIREFAQPDTPIHVAGPEGVRRTFTLDELLPVSFGPEHLDL